MTLKNGEKGQARALQRRTGWTYSESLRCVRTMTPEAIETLIQIRAASKPADEEGTEP